MKGVLALTAVSAVLAGCAAPMPQLSRTEYLAMTSRTIEAPKERVLEAAEEVLRLADGDDVQIHHNAAGFNAHRPWSVYLVLAASMGTDFWSVRATDLGEKSRIEVEVGRQASAIVPMATTAPGTWTAGTMPAGAMPFRGPALYELFFARIEYLLGKREEWPTCDWSNQRVESKATWGENDGLCNAFNVTDAKPEGPMKTAKTPVAQ